ncbi:MAG: 16S rRNA (guanine(966)-N(2))-methyltransferase RsmD [Bacteroidales bacterium]|nr:16S rRNA (guanine(966)-N(2))-methyltransferase RsmD [Bacteroidales bacterium]
MRIIRGSNKGRKIIAPNNLAVRPTTDMAKESLFNILDNNYYFEGLEILDLFAGTGNISYEFASRGCQNIIAVDNNYKCTSFIKETAEKLKFKNLNVVKINVFDFLKYTNNSFNIIFADPPYNLNRVKEIPELIFDNQLLIKDGWLIIEHSKEINFSEHPHFFQHRIYGKVNFSFFRITE